MRYLLIFVALTSSLFARIGETKEQLIARYGSPAEENGNDLLFTKNGMLIKATLLGEKCQWIRFSKDAGTATTPQPLAREQLLAIFNVNQDGAKWTLADDGTYRSGDGTRQAFVSGGTLVIQTADFKKAALTSEDKTVAEKTEAPVRMDAVAPTRVEVEARTATAVSSRDKKWETWWGSYDKEIFRDRLVSITLRASTAGTAIVETHWIGEDIEKDDGNKVINVERKTIEVPQHDPVSLEMGYLFVENDTKFAALGVRDRKGMRYGGWVVRVVDGAGNVLAVQGARPPLIALVK